MTSSTLNEDCRRFQTGFNRVLDLGLVGNIMVHDIIALLCLVWKMLLSLCCFTVALEDLTQFLESIGMSWL